ncbi:MAG: hypothetical protein KF767_12495 [Bdellovibrionaceae bacterium]|nr:hypothetical protein [Pseudobdellovibrionaceae bacterium]
MREIQKHFRDYADRLFAGLGVDENLILQLKGEDSLFLRWNRAKVRQSTQVRQFEVNWTYQWDGRQLELSEQLTLDLEQDAKRGLAQLARLKMQAAGLEKSHQLAPLSPAETSVRVGELPARDPAKIARQIEQASQDLDLIGFWCSGPMVRGVAHSKGLFLFEARDAFFFDYSIFTVSDAGENKAVKGFFSEAQWDEDGWATRWGQQILRQKEDLALLRRPSRKLASGKYRVYLAPSAMSSMMETMKSESFSFLAYKHGRSLLKDFVDGMRRFSPRFSVTEDFELGFAPRFNRLGEIAPAQIPLISEGHYRNSLVSGKTAREYGVASNGGEDSGWETEAPRSYQIAAGELPSDQALAELGTGVWINETHYTNFSDLKTARITGMTRYACFWVENGRIVEPIQDMRFDVSLFDLFGEDLVALTKERKDFLDVGTYHLRVWAGSRLPGVLAQNFNFTL